MKEIRKIIEIDEERCDGCGQCVPSCAEGAIRIVDGKARVIDDRFCDGLGACLGECPRDALKLIEREAEEFDEAAVDEHLKALEEKSSACKESGALACGCPSTRMEIFESPADTSRATDTSPAADSRQSFLGHWPVKIRLIPTDAPFLKNADLLVTADCVPVACPAFQADFLKGRTVMIGCPKFDNMDGYLKKFTEIFKTVPINSITALVMEVPCCAGLPGMLKKALDAAGVDLPVKQIVVSARGEATAS